MALHHAGLIARSVRFEKHIVVMDALQSGVSCEMKKLGFHWTMKDSFQWMTETRDKVRSVVSNMQNASGWEFIENAYAVVPPSNQSSD